VSDQTRQERLLAELESMRAVKNVSTILDFEATGQPPDRYTITFRGKGINRGTSSRAETEEVDLHRCDIRMSYSYPERPPDIRWLTPIFHPNISFSGFLDLKDVGLHWEKQLTLDVVCERLWDVARLAYLNLDKATNYSAKNWFETQSELETPVDARTLRDKTAPSGSNVVRYQRRGAGPAKTADAGEGPVMFIGEDTPAPPMPERPPAPQPRRPPLPRPAPRRDNDDDVLYIGDE
jgi:ubiquitin-protein ligase